MPPHFWKFNIVCLLFWLFQDIVHSIVNILYVTLKSGGTNKWNYKETSNTLKLLIIFNFLSDLEENWGSYNATLSLQRPAVYMDIYDML